VDEVDVLAVDLRGEVVELVEPCLTGTPVVGVVPVRDQLPQEAQLGPVVPARVGDLLREPRAREALPEVVEDILGDVDVERLDAVAQVDAPQ
jgi:hypothetical protein